MILSLSRSLKTLSVIHLFSPRLLQELSLLEQERVLEEHGGDDAETEISPRDPITAGKDVFAAEVAENNSNPATDTETDNRDEDSSNGSDANRNDSKTISTPYCTDLMPLLRQCADDMSVGQLIMVSMLNCKCVYVAVCMTSACVLVTWMYECVICVCNHA